MATANTDLYLRSQASKDTSPVATDLYLRSADEKAGILLVGTNTITVSAPTATRSPGYVVWMESGSDATSDTSFFSSVGGAVTSATDQYHTGSRSIKCSTGSPAALATAFRTDVLADTGRRVSFWMRYDTTPIASAAVMLADTSGGATVFNLRVTPTNLMAVIFGSDVANGSIPLEPNQWNRITVSYVITSATEFRIDVYVNGVLDISAKNSGTLTNIGTSRLGLRAGTNFGANANLWFDDIYVDDGGDFTDPGDIRVTAKRPNANGANNTFDTTTSTTNSGYGTGNAIYVNERPLATTGARSQAGTGAAYENFAIENAATGDVDITGKTIKGRLSWVHGSGVSTDTIYDNGTAVVPDSVFTTTAGNRYVVTTSNAYPSSSSAVGMGRPTGNATDAVLNEAGMLIAFVGVSSITLSADTNTVTTSAPTATESTGATSKSAGEQTITISAPSAIRTASIIRPVNTLELIDLSSSPISPYENTTIESLSIPSPDSFTVSAPIVTRDFSSYRNVDAQNITASGPTVTRKATISLAGNIQSITANAATTTSSATISKSAGAQTVTITANTVSITNKIILTVNQQSISISAPIVSVKVTISLTTQEQSITINNPNITRIISINRTTETQSITISAPTPTLLVGSANKSVNTQNIIASAPISLTHFAIPVNTNTGSLTAPAITIRINVPVFVNEITSTANSPSVHIVIPANEQSISISVENIKVLLNIPVATNLIDIAAPFATLHISVPTDEQTVTITSPQVIVHNVIPANEQSISISVENIKVLLNIPVATNLVDVTSPLVVTYKDVRLSSGNQTVTIIAPQVTVHNVILLETNIITALAGDTVSNLGIRVDSTQISITAEPTNIHLAIPVNAAEITLTAGVLFENSIIFVETNVISASAGPASVRLSITVENNEIYVTNGIANIFADLKTTVDVKTVSISAPNVSHNETISINVDTNTIVVTSSTAEIFAEIASNVSAGVITTTNELVEVYKTTKISTTSSTIAVTSGSVIIAVSIPVQSAMITALAPTVTISNICRINVIESNITVIVPIQSYNTKFNEIVTVNTVNFAAINPTVQRLYTENVPNLSLILSAPAITVGAKNQISIEAVSVVIDAVPLNVKGSIKLPQLNIQLSIISPIAEKNVEYKANVSSASIQIIAGNVTIPNVIFIVNNNTITVTPTTINVVASIPNNRVITARTWVVETIDSTWYANRIRHPHELMSGVWIVEHNDSTWYAEFTK